jgi:hypothetical protein
MTHFTIAKIKLDKEGHDVAEQDFERWIDISNFLYFAIYMLSVVDDAEGKDDKRDTIRILIPDMNNMIGDEVM